MISELDAQTLQSCSQPNLKFQALSYSQDLQTTWFGFAEDKVLLSLQECADLASPRWN